MTDDGPVMVWLVEPTYGDDELNLVILTLDGERYSRKERALTSFTGPARETPVSLEVNPDDLSDVSDPARRERFASEAIRKADEHDPGDALRVSLQQEESRRWLGPAVPACSGGLAGDRIHHHEDDPADRRPFGSTPESPASPIGQ
jgi:hypothetical protein